jgi:hypothetical protein
MQGQTGGPRGAGVAVPATPGPPPDDPGERSGLVRFLGRVGLFHGSAPELLAQVAAVLRPLAVAAGDVVCREGEPGDQFYLIEAGTLAIIADIGGQPRELARLGPGEFFGEMALWRLRAPFHPVIDPPRSGEKLGGMWLLGRPPNLAAKAKGDRSMVGKRERPEDAYGRGSQDPRDMVKGTLPEPQSPVMHAHVPRSASGAGPPG